MDSGENTLFLSNCVCDTCDNPMLQQNREIAASMSDSQHCVFWSHKLERRRLVVAQGVATTIAAQHNTAGAGARAARCTGECA